MDQRDAALPAQRGQDLRPVAVGAPGGQRVTLGGIDRGIGGGVDHQRRIGRGHRLGQTVRPVEIERRPADHPHGDPPPRRGGPERLGQLPGPTGHQHGHAPAAPRSVNHAGQSLRRGSTRSLSDSTAFPASTGQGSARSGSSHTTPRSDARS